MFVFLEPLIAWLLEAFATCAEWAIGLFGLSEAWLVGAWAWISRSAIAVWLLNEAGKGVISKLVRAGTVGMLLLAWGVFLATFWTFFAGQSMMTLISTNPLTGIPADALGLISHAFPLKFMFGLTLAYIHWRLTLIGAALLFSKQVRFMAGA